MSAQLADTGPRNSFTAHLALAAGVTAIIHAPTLSHLRDTVAKLQPVEPAANDAATAPKAQPEGNASASTGTQASAQGAGGGSAASDDAPRPTYNDVTARVLALAKVGKQHAVDALKEFGVDHAQKLKLEQYPAFIAAADKKLEQVKK